MLDFYGRQAEGSVQRTTGAILEVGGTSLSFVRSLPPSAHVRAQVAVRSGVVETVLTRLGVQGETVTGQIVGVPAYVQRRTAPRVQASIPAQLAWFDGRSGASFEAVGVTHNVSVGGALLGFDQSCPTVSEQTVTALLGLQLPSARQPLCLAVRVVQAWDGGARVQIVEASTEQIRRLRGFVETRL